MTNIYSSVYSLKKTFSLTGTAPVASYIYSIKKKHKLLVFLGHALYWTVTTHSNSKHRNKENIGCQMVLNVMGKAKYGQRTGNARQSRSRRVAAILQRAGDLTLSTLLIMQRCTGDLKELRETEVRLSQETHSKKKQQQVSTLWGQGFPGVETAQHVGQQGWSEASEGKAGRLQCPVCACVLCVWEKWVSGEPWEQWPPQSSLCLKRVIRALMIGRC